MSGPALRLWPDHQTVWRWHFYAGLVCIPFVLWLATTGSIYLFKPQIDAWLDRPYAQLNFNGAPESPAEQVRAALAAVPNSVLNAYELPATPKSAARVLVGKEDRLLRVYVHPHTLKVLRIAEVDQEFSQVISHLHGQLLLGDRGSMIVEAAASWTIIMLITGLYLWWPRSAAGLGGVLYPRLVSRGRRFWRDLHAVAGLWISMFALFLLLSGLPWAKSWGGMLREVRSWGAPPRVAQDWTTGRSSELNNRRLANAPLAVPASLALSGDEHAAHRAAANPSVGMQSEVVASYDALDKLAPIVASADLVPPVLIAPPSKGAANWTARSDTPNRPRRVTLQLDGQTGQILSRQTFADRPWPDRVIGVGIAAHEGQLFAPWNQALGLFTAVGLWLVSISAIVLWWRRRAVGTLGAPLPSPRPHAVAPFLVLTVMLALLFPLFGISLLLVLSIERGLLRRFAATRHFLGLNECR